jgi:hypothetical protein
MPIPVASIESLSRWRTLGEVAPTALVASRETLHHAAQLLALAGASFVDAERDDSHTSMTWMETFGALATQPMRSEATFRFALRVVDLTLLVIDDSTSGERASFPLHGRTREEALAWMRMQAARAGLDGARLRSRLHFTIAPHVTDSGGIFERPTDGTLEELARWYGDASLLLEEQRASRPDAEPVRCWPHHFDIATLVRLQNGPIQTIGIGLSPGDGSYAEPYYYVGPYPAAPATPRPLTVGHWHTAGWSGAAIVGSEIVSQRDGADQAALVRGFVDEAIARLLESNTGGT